MRHHPENVNDMRLEVHAGNQTPTVPADIEHDACSDLIGGPEYHPDIGEIQPTGVLDSLRPTP
jgi:hypothetical protein